LPFLVLPLPFSCRYLTSGFQHSDSTRRSLPLGNLLICPVSSIMHEYGLD
jgi:hypothetical protein